MSASEKLKALSDEAERWTNGTDYVWPKLMDALPQIVAVVEAAERLAFEQLIMRHADVYLSRDEEAAREALGALDEVLSSK